MSDTKDRIEASGQLQGNYLQACKRKEIASLIRCRHPLPPGHCVFGSSLSYDIAKQVTEYRITYGKIPQ